MRRAIIMSILFGLLAGLPSTGFTKAGKWDRNAVYAARVAALEQAFNNNQDTLILKKNTKNYLSIKMHELFYDYTSKPRNLF
jgi:hypothetical protein